MYYKLIEAIFKNDLPINIEHFKREENTESGIVLHDFIGFNISGVEIQNVSMAKMVAKKLGETVLPYIDNLIKNTNDKSDIKKYKKTRAWINKKAICHPRLVEKCTHKLLYKMKIGVELKNIPLTYRQLHEDLSIIAVLHDIGRLSEINIAQGVVMMKRSGLNKNHAAISFDILEHTKIKPEILLAIKYHEFADIDEAINDDIYKKMSLENQKITEFYIRVLQDMDKTANLLELSKFGIKKQAEMFDPNYIQDYGITDEYLQIALSGKYLNNKGGHLIDAMIRFVTWTFSIHFNETKEILSGVLTDFFEQMYKEAWREYEVSDDKNSGRLVNTLERIMRLEDYAIAERMNMKISKSNRKKIINQINKLKG